VAGSICQAPGFGDRGIFGRRSLFVGAPSSGASSSRATMGPGGVGASADGAPGRRGGLKELKKNIGALKANRKAKAAATAAAAAGGGAGSGSGGGGGGGGGGGIGPGLEMDGGSRASMAGDANDAYSTPGEATAAAASFIEAPDGDGAFVVATPPPPATAGADARELNFSAGAGGGSAASLPPGALASPPPPGSGATPPGARWGGAG